jgi:hypothetical protein
MLKRLFPTRWARIVGWTIAGLSWGTTAVALAASASESATTPLEPISEPQSAQAPATTTTVAPLPSQPSSGLVVLRFTPVAPPPPEIITRTVTVAGGGGGGRGAPTVTSSGS